MLRYKGPVESEGREVGVDAEGNNQRQGQQIPRNRDYKGKESEADWSFYIIRGPSEVCYRYTWFKKSQHSRDGATFGRATKLMLDAFKSGKSVETNQISASKARKALTFEGNSSGTAMEGLDGTYGASGTNGMSVEEAEPKALEEKLLLPDSHVDDKPADFDVEEDDQLMETETEEVLPAAVDKERQGANKKKLGKASGAVMGGFLKKSANKKKLGKASGSVMGGSLKKRLVQSVVSPRKKHTAKQGSKSRNAEDGFLSGITACCGSWYYISRDLRVTRCGSSG
ncbi:hypothetical protein F2Q69_00007171 [Brassica cretica]|uniref:Uncharacterized protein n=1 Tax=Brassica cretica TaxID=69181 RepID=A0A8S9PQF1_BRACR|nr:hypothetical protein F2Q69_00007171 [Brassica cretica]